MNRGIKIIHQAGERNIEETKKSYLELGIKAEVFGFTKNISEYVATSRLCNCKGWSFYSLGTYSNYVQQFLYHNHMQQGDHSILIMANF